MANARRPSRRRGSPQHSAGIIEDYPTGEDRRAKRTPWAMEPEPGELTPAQRQSYEKIIKDRTVLRERINDELRERQAKAFRLATWSSPLRTYAYPDNPFSWKKFNIFGEKFERVWGPARATVFLVSLPFRLAWFPISLGSRFAARAIAKYQITSSHVKERAIEVANSEKVSMRRAKEMVRAKDAKSREDRKSTAFQAAMKADTWTEQGIKYGDAVEQLKRDKLRKIKTLRNKALGRDKKTA